LDRCVRVVAIALAAAFLAPAARAQSPAIRTIQSGLTRMTASGTFSGDVLVARHGRIVFQHAYGLANRSTRRRNDLRTRFNLASVGKTFTAVAIARLVEERRLRFGDTVGRYLPELPAQLRRITIAQLLDHTSGLGDFFGNTLYESLRPTLTSLRRYLPLIGNVLPATSCSGWSSSARATGRTTPSCAGRCSTAPA
jgi:CubicO group peptidase (beta-lactamase class C family)